MIEKLNNFNIKTDNEKVVHYNFGKYIIFDLITLDYIVVNKVEYTQLLEDYKIYLNDKSGTEINKVKVDYLDKKQLVNLVFITGFDCNYKCDYCYQNEYKTIKDKMQVEDFLKIKEFYNVYDNYFGTTSIIDTIGIMGGEPFLESNLMVIKEIFEQFPGSRISFTTNGANIMEYKSIIRDNRESIDRVVLSIDGDKDLHLKHRKALKNEFYDNIWEGLQLLLDNDIEVLINTVYHPEDNAEYPYFFDKLERYGWLKNRFSVNFNLDITKTKSNDKGSNYVDMAKESFKNLLELDNRGRYVHQNLINYNQSTMYSMIKQKDKMIPYKNCEIGIKPSFVFLPTGDVVACLVSNSAKLKVGTYKPTATIIIENIRRLYSRDVRTMHKCNRCEYRYFCKGGCIAKTLNDDGNLDDGYCGRWKEENYEEALEDVLNQLIKEESIFIKNGLEI